MTRTTFTAAELEQLLVDRIADLVEVAAHEIDPEAPHADYGLDSASAVLLLAELEDELGIALAPSLVWDHPNLRSLAAHIARELEGRKP